MPKVSINIANYNSKKYLPFWISSILNQNFKDFEVVIIDNDSKDGSKEYIKENYDNIKLIENPSNLGFSHAHNQAILENDSEYILIMNQDVFLENDFLEILIKFADENREFASFGGKLKKMKFSENSRFERLDYMDSLYLKHNIGYKFNNFGEGIHESNIPDVDKEVFGISGALVMYRRSTLNKVRHSENEYFDDDFFMYKEDIDLAWRLQNAGFKSAYLKDAVAYHERTFIGANNDIFDTIKRKKGDNEFLAKISYRNHLYILLKNLSLKNFVIKFPFIFYEELKKFLYYLFFKRKVLFFAWKEFFKNFKKIYRKRA